MKNIHGNFGLVIYFHMAKYNILGGHHETKKQIFITLLIVIFAISTLVGCGNKTETMTDREGNSFKLPQKINTIISTAPSNTEILVGLGLSDKLASYR